MSLASAVRAAEIHQTVAVADGQLLWKPSDIWSARTVLGPPCHPVAASQQEPQLSQPPACVAWAGPCGIPVQHVVSHTPSEITCHRQAFAVSHLLFASPRFLLSSSQHTHALLKYLW